MANKQLQQSQSDFYVYAISIDGVVRYIGKGRGSRIDEHLRTAKRILRVRGRGEKVRTSKFYNRLARAVARGDAIENILLISGLGEKEAIRREVEQIAAAPVGQLWNTFSGGNGFSSEWVKSLWNDTVFRTSASARSRANWDNTEFRANQLAVRNSPQHRAHMGGALRTALSDASVRQRMSEKRVQYLSDPDRRARVVAALNRGKSSEEWRRRQSEDKRAKWADPAYRADQIARFKAGWADPEKRARQRSKTIEKMTQEHRKRLSAISKANWANPDYRASQMTPEKTQKRRAAAKASWILRKAKVSTKVSV